MIFTMIICGVPQGAALSPLLFNVYVRPLCALLDSLQVTYATCEDDTPLCFSFDSSTGINNANLTLILETIKKGMGANAGRQKLCSLDLNPDVTNYPWN